MREIFNYISFAMVSKVTAIVDGFTFPRSRLFEYTPSDIRDSIAQLDEKSINILKHIPTFLCSEIYHNDDHYEIFVIYGMITHIAISHDTLECKFRKIKEFGTLSFPNPSAASAILGVDRFQLSRTHWSVRDGSDDDIISRINQSNPSNGPIANYARDKPLNIARKERTYIQNCKTVESFLRVIRNREKNPLINTFYRGHSDASFDLLPSLMRKDKSGNETFRPHEYSLYKEMIINHNTEFVSDQRVFDKLVRMRHYGLPTRLLDVTSNPLVALFFSCYDINVNIDTPGEVVIIGVESDKIEYYDSEAISILSNLSQITWEQAEKIDLSVNKETFSILEPIRFISTKVKEEFPYFNKIISRDDISTVKFVKSKISNDRIKSQSGAFILFGNDFYIPENGINGISIERIRITNKLEIINQLSEYGIDISSVYPGMDNTSKNLIYRITGNIN